MNAQPPNQATQPSLETADVDAGSAWDVELLRRLSQVDAGTADLVDRAELVRRMRSRNDRAG